MPHARLEDLPSGGGGRWPSAGDALRSMQWGDMEVGLTTVDAPLDGTELDQLGGMPGGICVCPHYGYVFEGKIRARYPNTGLPDEVAVGGEAYFFSAGHILMYDEPTKAMELNPAYALQQCMDATERGIRRMMGTEEAAAPG